MWLTAFSIAGVLCLLIYLKMAENQKNIFNLLDSLYDACYQPAKNDLDQIREIAENKMKDLNASTIDGAIEMVKGSARSMGLEVLE